MSAEEGFLKGEGELLVPEEGWHYYNDQYDPYKCWEERFAFQFKVKLILLPINLILIFKTLQNVSAQFHFHIFKFYIVSAERRHAYFLLSMMA